MIELMFIFPVIGLVFIIGVIVGAQINKPTLLTTKICEGKVVFFNEKNEVVLGYPPHGTPNHSWPPAPKRKRGQ